MPLFSLRLLKMLAEADARGRLAADRAGAGAPGARLSPGGGAGHPGAPLIASPRPGRSWPYSRAGSPTPRRSFTTTAGARCCCSAVCRGQGRTPGCVPTLQGLRSSHRTRSARRVRASAHWAAGGGHAPCRGQAKALLRQRIPFAWNATSVSQSLRARSWSSFSRYGSRVRIVCC